MITIEEIIEFFEKDIKASEKRMEDFRKDRVKDKLGRQIEITCCIQEQQTLRYVISKLKQFNNQKK